MKNLINTRRSAVYAWAMLALLGWAAAPGLAQNYTIDWYAIKGGGGLSTGGVYSVNGTIGQPDAGTMSGGQYSLTGGFWSMIGVVQTPGAPLLSVTQTNNAILISWPQPAAGFVLQQTANLTSTNIPWGTISPPYQTNTANFFYSTPSAPGRRFYRLMKP